MSTAEDFAIRIWDLVLKKEVTTLRPRGIIDKMAHATTSIVFTNDRKILITSGRDNCLHFWNVEENYKHLSTISCDKIGGLVLDEINCMVYCHVS